MPEDDLACFAIGEQDRSGLGSDQLEGNSQRFRRQFVGGEMFEGGFTDPADRVELAVSTRQALTVFPARGCPAVRERSEQRLLTESECHRTLRSMSLNAVNVPLPGSLHASFSDIDGPATIL